MAKGMIRWSQEQLDAFKARTGRAPVIPAAAPKKKAKKFNNIEVMHGGVKFDSFKELSRWLKLKDMEKAGHITQLQRQVKFVLAPGVKLAGEPRKKPDLRYFADATYLLNGKLIVEDTKSKPTRRTASYRNKKHLMKTVHGIDIFEI